MRKVDIGGKELAIHGSPLSLLYYQQEFSGDLMADLVVMQEKMEQLSDGDYSQLDSLQLLKFLWVLNKTAERDQAFPNFEKWLDDLEVIDFSMPEWIQELILELKDKFFRSI